MGRKPKHFTSFSKVLMHDFASKLLIPPEFVMRDLDGKLPAKALIKDRNYSHWWTVKVKTTGEKNHYSFMRSGWRKLVRDCELKEMDFLVFKLISNSVFEVVRYAPNGCEKELIRNPIKLQDSVYEQIKENPAEAPKTRMQKSKGAEALPRPSARRSRGKVAEASGSGEQIEHPSFTVVIRKFYRSRLTRMAEKKSVKLRNEEGKEWTVDLCIRNYPSSYGRIDLGVGWPAFCKENEIVDGDSCLFKFIKSAGDVIDVVVQRGGRGVNLVLSISKAGLAAGSLVMGTGDTLVISKCCVLVGRMADSEELRRQKRKKLLIYIAAFVVFQTAIIVLFSLTVMKVKTPKFKVRSATFGNFDVQPTNPSFALNVNAQFGVKNTNFGPYKYDSNTVYFYYNDVQVGSTVIPKSKANFLSTKKINVAVDLTSANISSNTSLASDLNSGTLPLTTKSRLSGKVELMLIFKKKKSVDMNCTMDVNISTRELQNVKCK
ncbi:hypothetical protein RHGRI_023480 [Rhododendron griersonianum]|uniref:TF-B3 domain-containing protein n=1 Tax=Rhododendron griersonianum TaxID=479676 RepID=A0AAV6J957_9ERIC|nr:hypothetical protein RHGRI_023480 [Rhododendron griersonianum]